ncbi:MAG: SH3 domain-containing protein [Clostridia bacterium]|nr:SH3 domain-containing protein [Clostridia bacterium]
MSTAGFLPRKNLRTLIKRILVLNIVIYMCIGLLLPNFNYAAQTKYPYTKGKLNNYPGYEALIQSLITKHPNWNFTILETGLDWNEVIKNETVAIHGRNLVYYTDTGNWVCSTCGDRPYDTGLWKCASEATVSYYMDPRNWLNESNIFQFENLAYNGEIQNIDGVNKILSSVKWASGNKIHYIKPDGTEGVISKSYAQVIMEASAEAGISPYHLAARIKQEQGAGTTLSATGRGDNATYKGYYNLLNIKATGGDVVGNALRHAKSEGWNDPEKSIIGGARFIASSYITKGQSTLYLQKFDVDNSDGSLYYHQYMQNVSAAYSEGNMVRSSYESMGLINSNLSFVIPVYNNMPTEMCPSPAEITLVTQNVKVKNDKVIVRSGRGSDKPEIAKVNKGDILLRIEISGTQTDGYNWDKIVLPDGRKGYIARNYIEKVDDVTNANTVAVANTEVNLRNGPGTTDTRVISTLTSGQSVTIIEKGKYNGLDGFNWSRVKLSNGVQGYLASNYLTKVEGSNYTIAYVNCNDDGRVCVRSGAGTNHSVVTTLGKNTKVTVLKKAAGEANGYKWDKIVTADGLEGYIANSYLRYEENKPAEQDKPNEGNNNQNANTPKTYKLGDCNGDNTINSGDLLSLKKYLLGTNIVKDEGILKSMDVNKDGAINSGDLLLVKKHLLGTYTIK